MLNRYRTPTRALGAALLALTAATGTALAQGGPAEARLGGLQKPAEPARPAVQRPAAGAPAAQAPAVSVQRLQRPAVSGPSAARTGAATPEPGSRPSGLSRARLLFANADQDDDSQVSLREALAQGLERPTFAGFDDDGDQLVTQDEYIVGMRDLLSQAGQPVDADLAAEATRIQALRRARAAQEQRTGGPASLRTGGSTPPVERSPAERAPAERAPVERAPVERAPVERATVERPSVPRPTVERPSVGRPTVQTPTVQRPALQRPSLERPQVLRPIVVERPGVQREDPFARGSAGQPSARRGQASPLRGQGGQVDPRRVRNARPTPNLRGLGSRPVPTRPGVQRPSTPRPAAPQRPSSSTRN